MDRKIIINQSLYPIFSFGCFLVSFLILLVLLFKNYSLMLLWVNMFLGLGTILYSIHIRKIKKYFNILIQDTKNIIDNQPLNTPYIDGESSIAVMSSHLRILDSRMKGMIERLKQDQLNLKDYIEDISHQIKTPLTSMILREEMLLELMDDSKEKDLILNIYNQSIRIKDLTESLLHLAQIDSHSIEYKKAEYRLEEIIQEVDEMLIPLKEEYKVQFNLKNLDNIVYCDKKWLNEAIENILKNCIEQKRDSKIDIYSINYESFIEIYIKDYGQGFSKDDINKVFDRFYQGHTSKGKGVGIGLALSKGIIEGHHGSISIQNKDGALFKIVLPHKTTKSKFAVTK